MHRIMWMKKLKINQVNSQNIIFSFYLSITDADHNTKSPHTD